MKAPGLPSFGRAMREEWALDPAITYLNHGTVGATPKRVLQAQQAIREEIERQPSRFMLRDLARVGVGGRHREPLRLREAAAAVAAFVGARGDDLVFTDNATGAVNAVLRSLPFQPEDEILLSDHAYGGVANAAAFVARERGARVRIVELPFPAREPERIVEVFAGGLSAHTRLAIVDHITSESALVLPVARIAECFQSRGVPVLVDGAHAPGVLPLDIPALGVDWYAGNLHKWAWAPRSCGFLWARADRQQGLHPPVISWGLDQGFTDEFDWVGTRDPSPWLVAPEGIAFMRELGIERVRAHNHALAWDAANRLCARWGTALETAEAMSGAMVTLPLPEGLGRVKEDAQGLRDALLFEDRIEAQVHAWRARLWVRLSAQIYNDSSDFERLETAVAARA